MARTLPSGRVTFAFTDVVGSTRAFTEHGDRYVAAVQTVHETVARHTELHGGAVVKTEGDGAMLAFPSAREAVDALVAMQGEIEHPPADGVLHLRIRAGAHTGPAEPVADDYLALPVHVAARVSGAAGAGQAVVSQAVIDDLEDPGDAVEVGAYDLKDVPDPVILWKVAGGDAPLNAVPARRTNVAQPHTTFVGRQAELDELGALLQDVRLVTVVGTGGLGKTRLVSEFALRRAADVPAGVWLVELESLSAGDDLLPELAQVLGLPGKSPYDVVAGDLDRRGEIVLVLDNCEHLAAPVAELVADLLADTPRARFVCTSREALEIDGERVLRLAPMPVAEGAGAAEELFRNRAQSAGAALVPADDHAVAELCRALDGVPLAVELAAARAPTMPVTDLVSALAGGQLRLRRRGGDPRQRDLGALVAWSLERMASPEQDALYALSVLPGRFTADMATTVLTAVPGAPGDTVPDLVRRSLLDLDGSEYRMLVTVSTVARAALERRPYLRSGAMNGLCTWAIEISGTSPGHERSTLTPDQVRALEVAFDWAMEHELEGRGWILQGLRRWSLEHSISARTRRSALAVLGRPVIADPDELRLNTSALYLCHGTAMNSFGSSYVDRAVELLSVARRLDDSAVLRTTVQCAAVVLVTAGRYDEAEVLYLEAEELFKDDPRTLGTIHVDLGVCHHLAGRLEAAEEYYVRALSVLDAYPSDYNRLPCLVNLAEVMLDRGRAEDATRRLRSILDETLGRPAARAYALALLAEAEQRCGRPEPAAVTAREAEATFGPLVEHDPSLAPARERMRAALAAPARPATAPGGTARE